MLPVGFEPATPASDQPQTFALDPVPTVQGAGWAPGPVWTGAENFVFIGIRYPDRPARSESLYRLGHLGRPLHVHGITITSPMWNAVTVVLALCVCVCVCGGGELRRRDCIFVGCVALCRCCVFHYRMQVLEVLQ